MRKHEFLEELLDRLSMLPEAERDKAYAFYTEMIDDHMDDGMDEEEAIAKLGSLDEIVERIVADVPMGMLLKHKASERRHGASMIILLTFGFPIWFPVLISVSAVLFTLFVVFWVVALVLWVVFGSSAVAVVASLIGLTLYPETGLRLLLIGGVLACVGCALLIYPVSLTVTKKVTYGTHWIWGKLKNALLKRRRTIS